MPLNVTCCGLLLALSLIISVPLRTPAALGANVMFTLQLAPASKFGLHVLDCTKSPLTETLDTARAAFPPFVKVTVCAELVVFTVWSLKETLACETMTAGAAVVELVALLELVELAGVSVVEPLAVVAPVWGPVVEPFALVELAGVVIPPPPQLKFPIVTKRTTTNSM